MDLKLGHYNKDGLEVVDVEGDVDIHTALRLQPRQVARPLPSPGEAKYPQANPGPR